MASYPGQCAPQTCPDNKHWDSYSCSCVCQYRDVCLINGMNDPMYWDSENCVCLPFCPPENFTETCDPTNSRITFDQARCKCSCSLENYPMDPTTLCTSMPGTIWDMQQCKCVEDPNYCPAQNCPNMQHSWNYTTCSCECSYKYECSKMQGSVWNSTSCNCVFDPSICLPPSSCPEFHEWNVDTCSCECTSQTIAPPGWFWDMESCGFSPCTLECGGFTSPDSKCEKCVCDHDKLTQGCYPVMSPNMDTCECPNCAPDKEWRCDNPFCQGCDSFASNCTRFPNPEVCRFGCFCKDRKVLTSSGCQDPDQVC